MDHSLRGILESLSAHGTASGIVALTIVALVCLVTVARRWQLRRFELQWMQRRLSVPRRPITPIRKGQSRRADRRADPRRSGNPVAVFLYDRTDSEKIGEGRVVDRSMGGVCLSTANHWAVGSQFNVRPLTHRNPLPSIALEVCNARPDPVAWRLGCCFVKRPSWSVLMYLR